MYTYFICFEKLEYKYCPSSYTMIHRGKKYIYIKNSFFWEREKNLFILALTLLVFLYYLFWPILTNKVIIIRSEDDVVASSCAFPFAETDTEMKSEKEESIQTTSSSLLITVTLLVKTDNLTPSLPHSITNHAFKIINNSTNCYSTIFLFFFLILAQYVSLCCHYKTVTHLIKVTHDNQKSFKMCAPIKNMGTCFFTFCFFLFFK